MSRRRVHPAAIPPEVQRQWLARLAESWARINRTRLASGLEPPLFALDPGGDRLGRWSATSRTIGISVEHIAAARTWLEVELTLRHEMAHQVVSELFEARGAAPHGVLFARAATMLQVDASPRAENPMTPEATRVLRRVRKLLALGDSPNRNEAEAAMAAASKLLLRHNLALADAADSDGACSWRWIGRSLGRLTLEAKLVSGILQEHFFVRCIWVWSIRPKDGAQVRILECVGRPESLDLAEHVHAWLRRTLDRLWAEWKAARVQEAADEERARWTRGIGSGRMPKPKGTGRADRNAFRVGVLMGWSEHLRSRAEQSRTEGLVWLGDPLVDAFYEDRYPKRTTTRSGSYRTGEAHDAGRAAGRALRLRGPLTQGSSGGTIGLLKGR